jgi:hypothetical protein
MLYAQNTTALPTQCIFNYYIGHWSQAKESRLSATETDVKVNYKLHSQCLYIVL